MFQKLKKYLISFLPVIVATLLIVSIAYAWTEPSGDPPQNNVPAPVNVSDISQIKAGGLSLGSLIVNGGSDFNGDIIAKKNVTVYQNAYWATQGQAGVGIGWTSDPEAKLDIRTHNNNPQNGIRISSKLSSSEPYKTNFIVTHDGRVGIGISDPENERFPTVPDYRVLLDIDGAAKIKHIGLTDHNSIVRWVPKTDLNYFSIWSSQDPENTAVFKMNSTYSGGGDYAFSFNWASSEKLSIKKDGMVEINDKVRIKGGSPSDGKILVSEDSTGLAAWRNFKLNVERHISSTISSSQLVVQCDPGEILLSGGCELTGDSLRDSYPDGNTWVCRTTGPAVAINAYAICFDPEFE